MRKKLTFICFLMVGYFLFGQTPTMNEINSEYINYFSNIGFFSGKVIVNNGFLPLLDENLHDTDLAVLSRAELRILRNTIFAKHGLIFQSNDLTEHFRQFDWYNPLYRNVDDRLTRTDRWLIERIQAFENMQPNGNLAKSDLVGHWMGMFPVAAGDYNSITFFDDNTIVFGYNTMYPTAVVSSRGTYNIENGFLVVYITEQYLRIGEYFHTGWGSVIGGMDGRNYVVGVYRFSEPVRMVFPVSEIRPQPISDQVIMRQIGSHNRFRSIR